MLPQQGLSSRSRCTRRAHVMAVARATVHALGESVAATLPGPVQRARSLSRVEEAIALATESVPTMHACAIWAGPGAIAASPSHALKVATAEEPVLATSVSATLDTQASLASSLLLVAKA